ncbi:hypothetical protein [Streptomyces sp. TBY4]|uniref:hypothetical protein n=1 Tax=Streptomyces sp. TBY4 TaxID=2962030 RepID=UPI0020B81573|nr:hypothetical protein [Streptomyces sp. TBY4]MCP3757033.1 hypothetical protein [Streptomyces sp. TBY4]
MTLWSESGLAELRELLHRAVVHSDAEAMRTAVDRLFSQGPEGLSAAAEYAIRSPDYVMEMPQSRERIRGREAMRRMQETYPVPPAITVRRVTGAGRVWVMEGINDYAGDVWHVVLVLELDETGRIVRDTRYYGRPFPPDPSRAALVDPLE